MSGAGVADNSKMKHLPDFSLPLLTWYDENRRVLPWREEPTPYRVWVSEIMLQQTRVEAVKPYFARFMEALPTVEALAECPPERLNKLWEGLGYYSRVRNMQKAAKTICQDFGGVIPSDPKTLLSLSGIGSYTAGAIASFAYGVPAPAVDGNVLRVLSRVLCDDRNILDPQVKREYESLIEAVIPKKRAGDYNQALIELGATLCGPNSAPGCEVCPLQEVCQGYHQGRQNELPIREKKKPRRVEERTVLLICDGKNVLLTRRPDTGLLAGLYEFPSLNGKQDEKTCLAFVEELGLEPIKILGVGNAKHIFTHIEWHMTGYEITVGDTSLPVGSSLTSDEGIFVVADAKTLAEEYAIPSAYAKFLSRFQVEKGSKRVKK